MSNSPGGVCACGLGCRSHGRSRQAAKYAQSGVGGPVAWHVAAWLELVDDGVELEREREREGEGEGEPQRERNTIQKGLRLAVKGQDGNLDHIATLKVLDCCCFPASLRLVIDLPHGRSFLCPSP